MCWIQDKRERFKSKMIYGLRIGCCPWSTGVLQNVHIWLALTGRDVLLYIQSLPSLLLPWWQIGGCHRLGLNQRTENNI